MGEESEYSGIYLDFNDSYPNGYQARAFHNERGIEDVSEELGWKIHDRLNILNKVRAIEVERREKAK